MRHLLTNDIDTNIGMPLKSGTLDHLQLAYIECLSALAESIIGNNYDPSKVYVLSGLQLFDIDYSNGYVYYGGEIYFVGGITTGVAVSIIFNTDYYLGTNADPVEFTNGDTHNVHQIKYANLGVGGSINFEDFIRLDWQFNDNTSLINITSGTATISTSILRYKRIRDTVILNYNISGNISSYSGGKVSGYISLPIRANVYGDANGTIANLGMTYINSANFTVVPTTIDNYVNTPNKLNFTITNNVTGNFNLFGQITYPI